jgi:hypothetical protein
MEDPMIDTSTKQSDEDNIMEVWDKKRYYKEKEKMRDILSSNSELGDFIKRMRR